MPVILPPQAYDLWLDPVLQGANRLVPLLRLNPASELTAYLVRRQMNNP
jgi:putative SOS response-associated peptidase YedK